ncbi:hypothetical protein [Azospirillum doebereinerae]
MRIFQKWNGRSVGAPRPLPDPQNVWLSAKRAKRISSSTILIRRIVNNIIMCVPLR